MRRLAAAALIAAALAPAPAGAYVRTVVPGSENICLWWAPRTIDFQINELGSRDTPNAIAAGIAGYESWNLPDCSDLVLRYAGPTPRTDIGYRDDGTENVNLLVFRDSLCSESHPGDPCFTTTLDCNNRYNCWWIPGDVSGGIIALTTTTFDTVTGQLYDADIEMNGGRFVFTAPDPDTDAGCASSVGHPPPQDCNATDIMNTVTHEVGHVVGFDHNDDKESTMYRSAGWGERKKRDLSDDDVLGLCDVYPTGRSALTCLQTEHRYYGDGCTCGSAGGGAVSALALALAAMLRRRR